MTVSRRGLVLAGGAGIAAVATAGVGVDEGWLPGRYRVRSLLHLDGPAFQGWSMGGYGALRLGSSRRPGPSTFQPGAHDAAYWTRMLPAQLRFVGRGLGSQT